MHCINERFLEGCNFDEAYPNPCHSNEDDNNNDGEIGANNYTSKVGNKDKSAKLELGQVENSTLLAGSKMNKEGSDFSEEQQMKLRKIATIRAGLLNLIGAARAIEPLINTDSSASSQTQEKVFVYLLIAMVILTILVSIVMIVLIVNWTKLKLFGNRNHGQDLIGQNTSVMVPVPRNQVQPQLGNNYLSNQRQHYSNRHPYRNSRSSSRDRSKVKPLGSVSVVVSKSRRHGHGVDNSAL